ncbi:asparagine synthase (glutamine-hydrolyzing) [Frigoriglobus tundricola]|uniref:asparagine synthase (glutamine-hydrolyzing) n=1 Tax=Frigoriglobus tundricola TaxID=2774151 RepID=A0A6M5YN16_9BACT|nr:asparagine synthase (glutamine-hydrolyzing) [Frigoriglobus tundricola]QJW94342.1 Asparagine synthetase [glutamine-hydrolyzing] [Frigoriglobus tundricola]
MCGIAGMFDLSGQRHAPAGVVEMMARAIYHRGPDEDGYLERPGLHLANRRLSIVGLADGQQPIANEDRTVWTVFNGEFFDYKEKRETLEKKGHVFRTHTDTELVPHSWEDYGVEMLQHLKGQYAICVWDSRTNEVLLARDRSGICPLFYTVVKHDGTDWLLFASEMKALFASGLVPRKADLQGLNHIFTFMAMPGPTTVFEGIKSIAPGRYLHFQLGATTPERATAQKTYWQITYPDWGHEDYGGDEKKIVDGFEEVLYTAVERRVWADVPVVSYLSGGVDSSLVVAMANKVMGRPIPTFTISVNAKGLNEKSEALSVAEQLGCKPVVVDCGHDELRTGYPELIAAAEFPVIDTSCVGLLQLARSVHKNGYKVALTGEGADEWLAGYSWFKIRKLVGWMDRIPGVPLGFGVRYFFQFLNGQPRFPYSAYRKTLAQLGGSNGWFDVYGILSTNKLRFFTGAVRDAVLARTPLDDIDISPDLNRWHPFNRQMYFGGRVMLPGHLLASKGDRIAMHSSVETRYAFLDEDVIAYMAKVHPRWKLRGVLNDKYIERKVAERWLPKNVAWRRKKMFRAPMDSWAALGRGATRGAGETWIEQVLSPESVRKAGYFDPDAVDNARQKLARPGGGVSRTSLEMGLTGVLATQLWHHLYLSGDLCSLESKVGKS